MNDLRMQRAVLWFIVAMGDICASFGLAQSASWAAIFGLVMMCLGAWGLLHVRREIKSQTAILPSMMEDVAFRYELWRHNGRIDVARESLLRKRGAGVYK
jgi:hypothetical protein